MTRLLAIFLALIAAGTLAMLAAIGANALLAPPLPRHAAAEAAQEALGKALAASDLPTARKHAGDARGHVRRLAHLSPTCN